MNIQYLLRVNGSNWPPSHLKTSQKSVKAPSYPYIQVEYWAWLDENLSIHFPSRIFQPETKTEGKEQPSSSIYNKVSKKIKKSNPYAHLLKNAKNAKKAKKKQLIKKARELTF